jgi:hypothetical protein
MLPKQQIQFSTQGCQRCFTERMNVFGQQIHLVVSGLVKESLKQLQLGGFEIYF